MSIVDLPVVGGILVTASNLYAIGVRGILLQFLQLNFDAH